MMNGSTKTCATCAHAEGKGAQLECRAHPPQMGLVMQQGIGGARPALVPMIPVVAAEYRCGEWVKGVSALRLP